MIIVLYLRYSSYRYTKCHAIHDLLCKNKKIFFPVNWLTIEIINKTNHKHVSRIVTGAFIADNSILK